MAREYPLIQTDPLSINSDQLDTLIAKTIADTVAEIEGRLMGERELAPMVAGEMTSTETYEDIGHNTYHTHVLEVLADVKK